jgi:predicted nucleic acid-binding Zn ribbon protein
MVLPQWVVVYRYEGDEVGTATKVVSALTHDAAVAYVRRSTHDYLDLVSVEPKGAD